MTTLTIDVWSDIACPWCWVGKRNLDKALESFDGDSAVHWHAFELNPDAPAEAPASVDYAQRLAAKYGTERAGGQEMIERMVAAGRTADLDLRFDRIRPCNTFDAHRVIAWAQRNGEGNNGNGEATDVKERLFSAYLHEGRSVADHDELVEIAQAAGLDGDAVRKMLDSEELAAEVREDEAAASQLGVSGVPFFVLARRLAVSGAQPPEVLLDALRKAAQEDTGE